MGQLFIEHLLCTRKRAKEQVDKDENQEISLGLPIQQENIHPQPLGPKEGIHTPKLPPLEVQVFPTMKGGTGLKTPT